MLELGIGRIRQAYVEGDEEWGSLPCGQVCGMIDDIPTCQELIEQIITGAEGILETIRIEIKSN